MDVTRTSTIWPQARLELACCVLRVRAAGLLGEAFQIVAASVAPVTRRKAKRRDRRYPHALLPEQETTRPLPVIANAVRDENDARWLGFGSELERRVDILSRRF